MKYEITKPDAELTEGYFSIVFKYITLFLIGWMGCWVLLVFLASGRRGRRSGFSDLLFDNPEFTSIIIALAVIYFFVQRALKKYRLGLMTSIEFHETKLILGILNTLNGSHKFKEIQINNLNITLQTKQDKLFGKQRVFEIYENNVLITKLNIELTAWCRHPDIETLVTNLLDIKSKSPEKRQTVI